jgi:hypothetical protein
MMVITRVDDFVSRAAGEWRNSSERVQPRSAVHTYLLFGAFSNTVIHKFRVRLYKS